MDFKTIISVAVFLHAFSRAQKYNIPPDSGSTTVHGFPPFQSNDDLLRTAKTYISWGSSEGKKLPDCAQFQSVFGVNRTWESDFTGSEFFVNDVEFTCQHLAKNISWHIGELTAGNYLYPFYTQGNTKMWKLGFAWTAVGVAKEGLEVLHFKEYNFKIISTLWLQVYPNNVSYIFVASDYFWLKAGSIFPTPLKNIIDNYTSYFGGNCKTWAELFLRDIGMVTVSGENKEYFGPTQLTEYCSKMVYTWNQYIHNIHHMTYSVDYYSGNVDNVAFTWTRTGLYLGRVRTDEVLTVFRFRPGETPPDNLKIFTADNYFQPPMI
jgi:hypothetical protein